MKFYVMNILPALIIFLFISSVSYSQQDDPLKKYRWKNRVILLFAADSSQKNLISQHRILKEDAEGLRERDLVIRVITPESPEPWRQLANQFDTREVFTFILLGKDGGVKKRSTEVVSRDSLYSLIDSMPMRQAEMRRDDQK